MEKNARTSKITNAFNDKLDIDALANVASLMTVSAPISKSVVTPAPTKAEKTERVEKKIPAIVAPLKKDRRLTIIVPHTTYMKMVIKTKENGITFQKYINELIEKDGG